MPNPPDPFWLIVGFIAMACLALYPVRQWRRRHHRYGDATDEQDGRRNEIAR
jgi:hypothetical protein